MLDWAWNEISNLMLTAEIEMILADFCQTALCRSHLNSGRFICVGMTTDFILCNSSHHMLLMRPSILSNVSHCIISVIKFQSQFRLLARLQVAFVTLPVGEGLTPPRFSHTPEETEHMFRSWTAWLTDSHHTSEGQSVWSFISNPHRFLNKSPQAMLLKSTHTPSEW